MNSSFLFFSQVNIEPLLSSLSFLFVNHPFMMKFRMTLASPALLNPHIYHKFVIILCPTDFFATQLIVEYCTISNFVTAVVLCFFWEAIIDWHFLFLSTCIIHLLLLFVVVFNKSTKSNFFPTTYLQPRYFWSISSYEKVWSWLSLLLFAYVIIGRSSDGRSIWVDRAREGPVVQWIGITFKFSLFLQL